MDIQEIKQAKYDLEMTILGMIREFERQTECEINSIDVARTDSSPKCSGIGRKETILTNITTNIII